LCKMYVAATQRGTGVAVQLIAAAESHARAMGAATLDLWTDTRFDRAHRFYQRHGFVRAGAIRTLNDKSNSLEFHYAKPVSGIVVRALDTAAAASGARALGRLLKACVDDGASVSFMPPFELADAETFYGRRAKDIAAGKRVVLVAWLDGVMAGTVMLDLDTPPNQPHRLDLQKMLVSPNMRRRGIARVLLQAAETEARAAGRWLMVLDTTTGSAGDAVYRSMGWLEVGSIPDFAYNPDGSLSGTTLFYKKIPA
jgi:GNAT superfamily N-acetyltransferase